MNLSYINESNGKEIFLNLLLGFLENIGIIEVEKEELNKSLKATIETLYQIAYNQEYGVKV
jgi:hypothetical protein